MASGRRISFAEAPRPPIAARRVRIVTRNNSLASGFPFDPKLTKYNVTKEEWEDFSTAVLDAADLPKGANWAWSYHRKDIARRLKKDLQYEGDTQRAINAWNRHFRKKGFQASLELPGPPRHDVQPENDEEVKQLKLESKRFKMVITPTAEKGGSVYSRSSSLARSVSGEGANLQDKTPVGSEDEDKHDGEEDGKD